MLTLTNSKWAKTSTKSLDRSPAITTPHLLLVETVAVDCELVLIEPIDRLLDELAYLALPLHQLRVPDISLEFTLLHVLLMPVLVNHLRQVDLFYFGFVLVQPLNFVDHFILVILLDQFVLDLAIMTHLELLFDESLVLHIPLDLLFSQLDFLRSFLLGLE